MLAYSLGFNPNVDSPPEYLAMVSIYFQNHVTVGMRYQVNFAYLQGLQVLVALSLQVLELKRS